MIKALIFDFDGIVLESSEIKTIAFQRIFENEPPNVRKLMNDYHLTNMGFARQRKFEYYYNEVIKKPIPNGKIDEMSETFSKLVLDEILKADFVPGMPEFLEYMVKKYPLFVATGSPDNEIGIITKLRKLDKYFKGIYGTPSTKETIIKNIITLNGYRSNEIIFFGDAESDRMSALNTGVHFIGRIAHGSEMMGEVNHKIKDFSNIIKIQEIITELSKN